MKLSINRLNSWITVSIWRWTIACYNCPWGSCRGKFQILVWRTGGAITRFPRKDHLADPLLRGNWDALPPWARRSCEDAYAGGFINGQRSVTLQASLSKRDGCRTGAIPS